MPRHTSSYYQHRKSTIKYSRKTAGGKVYYYKTDSSKMNAKGKPERTRITRAEFMKQRGQNTKLVDKQGNVKNEKLLKRLEKKYGKAQVAKALRDVANTPGEIATYKHLSAVLEPDKLRKMFINIGRDPEDIAAEYDLDVNELLDPSHWQGDIFTSSDGRSFMFTFTYDGSCFTEITADE